MRIAIIGGGASGLACAHLLDRRHDVTLFEKQPFLGGNIRTLNRNVPNARLPAGMILDNGVIEFEPHKFPAFARLMADLGVELAPFPGNSACFLPDGRYLLSPGIILGGLTGAAERLQESRKLGALARDFARFLVSTSLTGPRQYHDRPVAHYFNDSICHDWLRLLLMYAYSVPYPEIDQVPAELALPMLRDFSGGNHWMRIPGGVYTYVERILERFRGRVLTGIRIDCVERNPAGVLIRLASGEGLAFDKLVIATTPDQVLPLLSDPNENERRRFAAWRGHAITTLIHTDASLYQDYGVRYHSEFDVFRKSGGRDGGYNAYLNRIAGLDSETSYYMAYNLEDRIDPAHILDTQKHWAPLYNVEAFHHRQEVIATNGEHHTFYAGAWLGNGLHEGAVASAVRVSERLGGRAL